MTRHLIWLSLVGLCLAPVANGAVEKGDTELEILGGWVVESGGDVAKKEDAFRAGETGSDFDGWSLSGGIGWVVTDSLQVGFTAFGAWMDGDNVQARFLIDDEFPESFYNDYNVDVEATVYGVGGRLRWHLAPMSRTVPYVGVQALYAWADVDVSGTARVVTVDGVPVPFIDPANISDGDKASGLLWGPVVGIRHEMTATRQLIVEGQYHLWAGDIGDVLDGGFSISAGIAFRLK